MYPKPTPCTLLLWCRRTNNAASGGFAGFSFPHAPRPIKEHKTLKKTSGPNSGNPFDPSQRPFILFKGNTVHSTGYNWEHAGAPLKVMYFFLKVM
jgi:hypothetical protein